MQRVEEAEQEGLIQNYKDCKSTLTCSFLLSPNKIPALSSFCRSGV
jgi:hypothetical protein